MYCVFTESEETNGRGWTLKTCKLCGRKVFLDGPPEKCLAACSAVKGTCANIGPEIRREECQTCAGTVRVKVFACAAHGACQAIPKLEGVKACRGCGDYQPTPNPP